MKNPRSLYMQEIYYNSIQKLDYRFRKEAIGNLCKEKIELYRNANKVITNRAWTT